MHRLTGQTITLEMAKNVLRDLIGDKKKIVAMEDIQEAVAACSTSRSPI